MTPRAAAAWLAVASLAACTRDARRADVDAAATDLVVHAVTDEDGRIVEVRAVPGDRSTALAFEEGQRLYSFVIDGGSFVTPAGTPLDADELASVRADAADRPGACGRCLSPGLAGAKVVHPGESCPPPAIAEVLIHEADAEGVAIVEDPERAELVRGALRLTWDGDCACERFSPRLSKPAAICPIAPERGKVRPDRWRLLEDGTIVGFNQGFGLRVDPSGDILEGSYPPAGPVEGVGVIPNSTDALLVTSNAAFLLPSVVHHGFDEALTYSNLGEPVLVDPARIVNLEDGAVHLVGETLSTLGNEPGIARCTYDGGRAACTSQPIFIDAGRCPRANDDVIRDAIVTSRGEKVALVDGGHVLYQPAGSDRWYCDPETDGLTFSTALGDLIIDDVLGVHAIDDRVFICAALQSPVDERTNLGVVLAFDAPVLPTDGSDPGAAGVSFELLSEDVFGYCRSMIDLEGGGFRVIEQSGLGAVDFDAQGREVARYDRVGGDGAELWAEIPHSVIFAQTASSGWTLAGASGHQLYRRAPGATAFEPAYAADPPVYEQIRAMIALDGDVWTFPGDGGAVLRVSRSDGDGCDAVSTESVSLEPPLATLQTSFAVALPDSRTPGRVVLVGVRGDDLVRADVDLVARTIASSEVFERTELRLRTGVELAPGRFLLVGEYGSFAMLDDDGVRPISPEHDDPTTEGAESLVPLPAGERRWWAADGRDGVAWVGGFGALARATVDGDGATVETFWLDRLFGGDYAGVERERPPRFTAMKAFCPDDAIFMAAESVFRNELTSPKSSVRAWLVGDDLASLDSFSGFGFTQDQAPSPGSTPNAVVGDGGRLDMFFSDSVIYRDGTPRTVSPFSAPRVAAHGDGFTLFGGPYGRVAAVVEAP